MIGSGGRWIVPLLLGAQRERYPHVSPAHRRGHQLDARAPASCGGHARPRGAGLARSTPRELQRAPPLRRGPRARSRRATTPWPRRRSPVTPGDARRASSSSCPSAGRRCAARSTTPAAPRASSCARCSRWTACAPSPRSPSTGSGLSILPATMLSRHLRDKFVAVPVEGVAPARGRARRAPIRLPRRPGARHPARCWARSCRPPTTCPTACTSRHQRPPSSRVTSAHSRADTAALIVERDRAFKPVVATSAPPPAFTAARARRRPLRHPGSLDHLPAPRRPRPRTPSTAACRTPAAARSPPTRSSRAGYAPTARVRPVDRDQGRGDDRPRRPRARRPRCAWSARTHERRRDRVARSPRCAASARGPPRCTSCSRWAAPDVWPVLGPGRARRLVQAARPRRDA